MHARTTPHAAVPLSCPQLFGTTHLHDAIHSCELCVPDGEGLHRPVVVSQLYVGVGAGGVGGDGVGFSLLQSALHAVRLVYCPPPPTASQVKLFVSHWYVGGVGGGVGGDGGGVGGGVGFGTQLQSHRAHPPAWFVHSPSWQC